MQIAHCGFQGFVSHRLLDGPGIGAPFQAVCGVAVPQFVRKDADRRGICVNVFVADPAFAAVETLAGELTIVGCEPPARMVLL